MFLKGCAALYAAMGVATATIVVPGLGLARTTISYVHEVPDDVMDALCADDPDAADKALEAYHSRKQPFGRKITVQPNVLMQPKKVALAVVACSLWPLSPWDQWAHFLDWLFNARVKPSDSMPTIQIKYTCRNRTAYMPVDLDAKHDKLITRRD